MNFKSLIGKIFLERAFFELIYFDMQEHFDSYADTHVHFYFDRLPNSEIRIAAVRPFKNSHLLNEAGKVIVEKREWVQVSSTLNRRSVILVRRDRTGWLGCVFLDGTQIFQNSKISWLPRRDPRRKPMTQEELREAFRELAGLMSEEIELQKLNSIRSA